jgi:hypothetical protein
MEIPSQPVWMAGGRIKGGFSYGSTDEYGFEDIEKKMHIRDTRRPCTYLD